MNEGNLEWAQGDYGVSYEEIVLTILNQFESYGVKIEVTTDGAKSSLKKARSFKEEESSQDVRGLREWNMGMFGYPEEEDNPLTED